MDKLRENIQLEGSIKLEDKYETRLIFKGKLS